MKRDSVDRSEKDFSEKPEKDFSVRSFFTKKEIEQMDQTISNGWARSRSDLLRKSVSEYILRNQCTEN